MHEGLLLVDPDHRVLFANPAAARLLNLENAPDSGTPLSAVFAHWSGGNPGAVLTPATDDTTGSAISFVDMELPGRPRRTIHAKFGPRIRLGKVLTDMPLQADKPIEFGVYEFCKACKKCATMCPAKCITTGEEMSDKNPTISENPGIVKWQVNHEECRANGWSPNATNCTVCISVCPYNKADGWLHDATKLAFAKTPFLSGTVARMDDLMDYGTQEDPNEWWKKEE